MRKKGKLKRFGGIVVFIILTAFFTLSCEIPDDSSDKNGGKIPSELVAKWYMGQALADAESGAATYEITSDGKLLTVGIDNGLTVTVEGKVITTYNRGKKAGTVKYSIAETVLTLTEATSGNILINGTFYKKGDTSGEGGKEEKILGSGTSGDFEYEYTASTIIITGYTGSGGAVTIPSEIDGKPVTSIGYQAFKANWNGSSYDHQLTSVIIPNSVITIGDDAFYNNKLTSVTIGNSVTSIGNYAFRGYSNSGNQLTSVIIPNSVITIGNYAFYENALTSVTIGNSVTSIGNYAFSSSGYHDNQLTSVIIPNSVITIGDNAFEKNALTSVTIGNSVRTIGKRAFQYNKLTSVTIPSSVTSIGDHAFYDNQLNTLSVDSGNTKYVSTNSFLLSKDGKKLFWCYGSPTTIPNSVTSIEDYAFQNKSLGNVTIPNNVTSIGEEAFAYNRLTNVTIPDSVTTIGSGAFYINDVLVSVTIGNNVTFIGRAAFWQTALTSVTIKANMSLNEVFSADFETAYNNGGKQAGTYTRPNANSTTWTKQ